MLAAIIDIRRDYRFPLEDQWYNHVIPCVEEGRIRGLEVIPLTVVTDFGVEGWQMHGWKPSGKTIEIDEKTIENDEKK